MKITGTIINYFFHCKRQCWLFMRKINLEDNSEEVRIGKVLHEGMEESERSEIAIENIKIDKITDNYLVEYKKSDSDLNAAIKQVQYYLYLLEKKGLLRKGRIEVFEKNKQNKKIHYVEYNEDIKIQVEELINKIIELYSQNMPPKFEEGSICKKCAYYEYCRI